MEQEARVTPDVEGAMAAQGATDEVEATRESQVDLVAEQLRAEVSESGGLGITELLDRMQTERRVSRSVLREALSRVLYSGELSLTEDRRLVAG